MVQPDFSTDDVTISSELRTPEGLSKYDDGCCATQVLFGAKRPAQQRRNAEHRKQLVRSEFAARLPALAAIRFEDETALCPRGPIGRDLLDAVYPGLQVVG